MEKKVYDTLEESRKAYDGYIAKHIDGIYRAFNYIGWSVILLGAKYYSITNDGRECTNHYDLEIIASEIAARLREHDKSKHDPEEFEPYRANFYPYKDDVKDDEAFDKAWEHHWKNNDHHPEYWKDKGTVMPFVPFIEMILDWIAVSIANKSNVLDWWFNRGGREGKKEFFSDEVIEIIDAFMNENKQFLDYSKHH